MYGNVIVAVAGFLFGSKDQFVLSAFIFTTSGLGLVIASACVFNNYIDRDIDSKMDRTKKRALASRSIKAPYALIFAAGLGMAGFAELLLLNSFLAFVITVLAYITYIGAYGYAKRRGSYGTLVGALAGASPPMIGYVGATSRLDASAVVLFLILLTWQMPHFYAIAIKRLTDYRAAGIPILPAVTSVTHTMQMIRVWTLLFIISSFLLFMPGEAGYLYLIIMLGSGFWWYYSTMKSINMSNSNKQASAIFYSSLKILMIFSVTIAIDGLVL